MLLLGLAGATGCTVGEDGELIIGSTSGTVQVENAMSWNAMSWNAMSWNAMSEAAMSHATGVPGVFELEYANASGLHHTFLGRQLLDYTTRCAYAEGEELEVAAFGSFPLERFHGRLGLAGIWKDGGLTQEYREMVSACLLAHVNYYGQSVEISVRFPGSPPTPDDESQDFYYGDAVFYGDLEGHPQEKYACKIREKSGLPWANSLSAPLRICDDDNCDIERVQEPACDPDCYCDDVCGEIIPDGQQWRFEGCRGSNGETYTKTVSVWLRGYNAPDCEPGDVGITCKPI